MNTIKSLAFVCSLTTGLLVAATPSYATSSASGGKEAVDGLKRQGDGGMGNKNADREMKNIEKAEKSQPEKAEKSSPSSGDKAKGKGSN